MLGPAGTGAAAAATLLVPPATELVPPADEVVDMVVDLHPTSNAVTMKTS